MADKSKLILVVDDDEGVRDLLSLLIKKEGHKVQTSSDGEEGFRKANSVKPDIIVLDLMLPRYGGFEFLRHLQDGELARVPIIVVTGRYTDSSTADLIRQESNVVELLEKPIKPNRFLLTVRKILGDAAAAQAEFE